MEVTINSIREAWNIKSYGISRLLWDRPQNGRIKVNIDGSFLSHNIKTGLGGIARNEAGDFLFAFAKTAQCKNHNKALVAQYASKWIKENGEANGVIDFLVCFATATNINEDFHTLDQMPSEAKGAYFVDRMQLTSIRIRYDKANFF
ncbi:hypothetical protein HAX54_015198, partial [Datura stramonium]|nr:hypothetical protein [Datura stramonium]